jgi:hypothetical protein
MLDLLQEHRTNLIKVVGLSNEDFLVNNWAPESASVV